MPIHNRIPNETTVSTNYTFSTSPNTPSPARSCIKSTHTHLFIIPRNSPHVLISNFSNDSRKYPLIQRSVPRNDGSGGNARIPTINSQRISSEESSSSS